MVSAHNVNPSKPVTFLSQAVSSIPMDGFSGFYDSVSLKSKSVQQSTHLIIIHEWYIYLHVCNLKSTKYTINVHMGGFHHLPWVLHNIEDFTPLVGPYFLELLVVGNHSSTYSANIYIWVHIHMYMYTLTYVYHQHQVRAKNISPKKTHKHHKSKVSCCDWDINIFAPKNDGFSNRNLQTSRSLFSGALAVSFREGSSPNLTLMVGQFGPKNCHQSMADPHEHRCPEA